MINIYYSKTVKGCNTTIFDSLKTNRKCKQIIFAPDRMTLQIEEQLFDVLDTDSIFDIDVMTMTRFTNSIIANHNIHSKVLTKPICTALVKKIMLESKDQFKIIKKAINFNGFSATLFQTISMFKSCNVSVDKIKSDSRNTNLNKKLDDIKLVYEKYENYLQTEYTDSFNKLNLLTNLIKLEDFKNTHFYFVGFDDFTPQMYNVILELAKNSASVNVACAVGFIDDLNNKNIFLNNVYLNLIDLANNNGVKYNRVFCKDKFNPEFKHISNNLFAINPKKSNLKSSIKIHKFNNINDEIEFALKKIQSLVVNDNISYNDVSIVVPSIDEYKQSMERFFTLYEIPYFLDESLPINTSIIVRFYNDLFQLVISDYDKINLFNFLRMYTTLDCCLLDKYQNYVDKSGFNHQSILKPIDHIKIDGLDSVYEKLNLFVDFNSDLEKCQNINDYCKTISHFTNVFGFNDMLSLLKKEYKNHNNVLEYNKLNSVITKVNDGFKELMEVLSDYDTTTKDAFDIVKAYFENITITMPPILVDSVFVTDINNSVGNKQFTFMLGFEDGKVPSVQMDLGLITDQEIEIMTNNYRLTPTINMINKRNNFKVYENILNAHNLYLSYVCVNLNGDKIMPSIVINNLLSVFDLNVINGSLIQHEFQNEFINDYFVFNNPNINVARLNMINNLKLIKSNNANEIVLNTSNLYHAIKDFDDVDCYVANIDFKNKVDKIDDKNMYFKDNNVSVSEIEKYYSCPYKHFVDYGLKLKENDTATFDGRMYGNVLHEYVKVAVNVITKYGQDTLKRNYEKYLDGILNQSDYEYLVKGPNNINDIKSLKREVERINTALINFQSVSQLKPTGLEKGFKDFTIEGQDISIQLKGIIDRVDSDDENFVIIDYKTGESSFSDFQDIYSGKKLQLIVYMYVVSKTTNKTPIGAFYMPLKNSYIKNMEDIYKLKGIVSSNLLDIVKIDKTLENPDTQSSFLNIKHKSNGTVNAYSGAIMLQKDEFDVLVDYTIKMILNAVKDINDGNITPYPLKTKTSHTCEYCKYKAMCKFSENFGNVFNTCDNVKSIEELK